MSWRLILSSAQLALAREYGFASWPKLKLEVERRDILNSRDLSRLTRLLAEHPELATRPMQHWADRQHGGPLGYVTMMRFNHDRLGLPRELPRHRRHRPGSTETLRGRTPRLPDPATGSRRAAMGKPGRTATRAHCGAPSRHRG